MRRVDGIRAVTYDCWGTLLKDHDWEGAMTRRAGALSRYVDLDAEQAQALLKEAWDKHDEAWRQVETFGPGRMAAYCLEKHGIEDDEALASLTREFEEASLAGGVDAVEGARETITALKENDIRIGLVCDTGITPARVVRELLDKGGLLENLEVQCFSDEVGVPKPGNDIFAKALAGLGCRPPEAVHIGDLRRTDIAGAHDIGMHAIRFRGVHDDRSDATDAHIVIDRHEELLEIIGLA
ncbi:MAG: HAD family hydrolase [Actinomycetota bacterium]|nr:HAD family hydrolase [Actinomycetota bacterium]